MLYPIKKAPGDVSNREMSYQSRIYYAKVRFLRILYTRQGQSNLGFSAISMAKTDFSYPIFDGQKVEDFLSVLKEISDIVIVDCVSNIQNTFTVSAFKCADTILRIANPDLKSISFFASQLPLMNDPIYQRDKQIVCLNTTDNTVIEPVNEAIAHFKEVSYTLPFCAEIKKQYMTGTLTEKVSDKKFHAVLGKLAQEVV